MKKLSLAFFCVIALSANSYAQWNKKTEYYNKEGKQLNDSAGHYYSRIIVYDKAAGLYVVSEYYNTGRLKFNGQYLDEKLRKKDGDFIRYYPDGKRQFQTVYNKGSSPGIKNYWYPNGKRSLESKESEMEPYEDIVINAWDTSGALLVDNGNGYYKEFYSDTFLIVKDGMYKDGKKDGLWRTYYRDGDIETEEKWNDGEFTSGTRYPINKAKESYILFESAAYPGGLEALNNYVSANIRYPPGPQKNGIQGKVYVQFTVHTDGTLTDIELKRGVP